MRIGRVVSIHLAWCLLLAWACPGAAADPVAEKQTAAEDLILLADWDLSLEFSAAAKLQGAVMPQNTPSRSVNRWPTASASATIRSGCSESAPPMGEDALSYDESVECSIVFETNTQRPVCPGA